MFFNRKLRAAEREVSLLSIRLRNAESMANKYRSDNDNMSSALDEANEENFRLRQENSALKEANSRLLAEHRKSLTYRRIVKEMTADIAVNNCGCHVCNHASCSSCIDGNKFTWRGMPHDL